MLVIRLSRTGKKNSPSYRLVVADKRWAVKGKYNDIVGFYNPIVKPKVFSANKEKILNYIKQGAQISVTALNLLCDHGILPKNKKIKIVHVKKKTDKEPKAVKAKVKSSEAEIPTEEKSAEKAETTEEEPKKEDQE